MGGDRLRPMDHVGDDLYPVQLEERDVSDIGHQMEAFNKLMDTQMADVSEWATEYRVVVFKEGHPWMYSTVSIHEDIADAILREWTARYPLGAPVIRRRKVGPWE